MADFVEANEKLRILEGRIAAVEESSKSHNDNSGVELAIFQYQTQMLARLKDVRMSLGAEGGDVGTIKKERDEALATVKKQESEIAKLNYRVQHLVKALDAEESRNKQL